MTNWQKPESFDKTPAVRSRRAGATVHLVIIAIVAVALIGGGLAYAFSGGSNDNLDQPITAQVTRGDFVAHVLDQGEIQSSENVEIRCKVESRGGSLSVLEVVPEGTLVKSGDFLVRLDSSSFERDFKQQKLSVSSAEISVIQAKANKATAEKSLKEYEDGTFVEQKIQIENEIYSAQMEFEQAEAVLKHTERLHKKGIAPTETLKSDRVKVQQARNSLELAKTKLNVLLNISKEKEMVKLQGDIDAAVVQLANQEEDLREEQAELAEIQTQIDNCVINVPEGKSGQVVYAKQFSRGGGTEWVLEEGASVRERQVLIRLPDPERMEVKAAIAEQSIATIDTGMPVSIKIDALSDLSLQGIVTSVSQYAEGGGWGRSSVPKFPVYIQIINPPKSLKPGMNASVTIQTEHQKNVLQIPIQCIYSSQDQHFCMVKKGDGPGDWETREIEVISDNSQTAWVKEGTDFTGEIKKGIEEGDEVAMNPGAYKDLLVLPEVVVDNNIEISDEQRKKFEVENADKLNGGKDGKSAKGKDGKGKGKSKMNPDAMMDQIFQSDSDGDGKLTKDEMSDRMKPMFDRADADKDGFVTREEIKKLFESFRGGGGGGGGGNRRGGGTN